MGDMTTICAGIDVSKASLNIHLNGRDDTATNDTDGFRKIAGILRDGGAERVVMEATGRMHRALLQSLHDRGFSVCVVYVAARDMLRSGRIGLPRLGNPPSGRNIIFCGQSASRKAISPLSSFQGRSGPSSVASHSAIALAFVSRSISA